MRPLRGIDEARVSAIAGIRRASARFEQAAETVAYESTRHGSPERVTISDEARALAKGGAATLEGALVEERIASHAFRANLTTLETADSMTDELLSLRR